MFVVNPVFKLFLLPGIFACDRAHVRAGDHQAMIRSLINMLMWSTATVLAVVALW